ncbi:hypothetical protein MAR_033746, partial [Mya arenaria]
MEDQTLGKHDNSNFPKVLMVDEDAHSTVFTRILDQVNRGHVSQEQLLRWMQQINDGVTHGTIAQTDLDAFTATLHSRLDGTAFANE